jgi:hypothetical protein
MKCRAKPWIFACSALAVLGAASASRADPRIWTDRTGRLQVEAEVVTLQIDRVWLRRTDDGELFDVPLSALSQADRDHVGGLLRAKAAEPAAEAPPGRIAYGRPRELARLANRAVDESSGLACSRRQPGLFWTHNDSGDDARLYLFDSAGRDLGCCLLAGVTAWDWEDVASFTWQGKPYLLVGDTGNNGLAADVHMLHLVEEPPIDAQGRVAVDRVPVVETIFYGYEDDHRDCEALAVDPTDRTILLATKQLGLRGYVYALPWPEVETKKALVARRIASTPVPLVTGMDVSPDGRRAILVTYGDAFEYERRADEPWADAFSRTPRKIAMPLRVQGESICYGPDGKTLYLTSEKTPTPLWEVPVAEPEPARGSERDGRSP